MTGQEKPLLIVVSESPHLPADVRARARDVRRWNESAPQSPDSFSGDPADPATFEWARAARSITAVIDLHPLERAHAALRALRSVRPDAAVLLLTQEASHLDKPFDGTLARSGDLREVLRIDLEEELARLEAERRVYCLRAFARESEIVPILIHPDPDPDAVGSALAVAQLLGGDSTRTPIVTLSPITRPENRRMVALLDIRVTTVTEEELRRFERIIMVDTQPRGLCLEPETEIAIIDHHPVEENCTAAFFDVRPEYGAAATIMTEYLRAGPEKDVSTALATALLFGIKTDTDSLTRGVGPADVEAYAFLQDRADQHLVRRIERPSYARATAAAFGEALFRADCEGDLCIASLGTLDRAESHALADLADFCLAIENVTWVVAAAVIDGRMTLAIRHTGTGTGAGNVARRLASRGGVGGGHATMARATMSPQMTQRLLESDDVMAELRTFVRSALEGTPTRRGSRRARRA